MTTFKKSAGALAVILMAASNGAVAGSGLYEVTESCVSKAKRELALTNYDNIERSYGSVKVRGGLCDIYL